VNPLDDNHLIGTNMQLLAPGAVPGKEIINRLNDRFTRQQSLQMGPEQGHIHCLQRFVIIISLFVAGCVFAVDKVVVHAYGNRCDAARHQLDCQSLAKGRLACGRGARN
jgi:hypothetical protein